MTYPLTIDNEEMLDELLALPDQSLIDFMKRLDGDIAILGIGGKMGPTLGKLAVNAIKAAGVKKEVFGVSRFGNAEARQQLENWGIKTISCDLMDRNAVAQLPEFKNIIYMAGRKFGTGGTEDLTWAMNVIVPAIVGERFKGSKITVFSTGCVYPLVSAGTCGCTEDTVLEPVGEYTQSCLGRERVFGHASRTYGTKVLLFRLNYAIDMRYGVLHDIGTQVWNDQPVTNTVGHFNVIWQGDANRIALLSLEHATSPANPLNVTGPEMISVEYIAERFAKLMGKKVSYTGKSADRCYLNNASKAMRLFGYPRVSLETMIDWQAAWLMKGGRSLGKPTHFEVNDGKF
ncbi:MAG: NAD-dependent epimerase/dehydratase family protein [Victivallaceae bacterium]